MGISYRVTGKYMTGSEIVAYHLVGSNGEELDVRKDKAILMISRGLIENLRVQYSNDDVIIRGKGVNLNTLPIYDLKKEQFRGTNVPESGQTKKTSAVNPMSQYKITKRIMYKTSCVGYAIKDASGREANLNRQKTIDFALKGLIVNAEAQKFTKEGSTESTLVLRGIGCNLKSLPIILVDMNGNVVDTTKNSQSVLVRATQSRKAGIIYNEATHERKTFSVGDYIVCMPNGALQIMPYNMAKEHMRKSDSDSAICDTYLEGLKDFSIEFLGQSKQRLNPQVILKWPIVDIQKGKKSA